MQVITTMLQDFALSICRQQIPIICLFCFVFEKTICNICFLPCIALYTRKLNVFYQLWYVRQQLDKLLGLQNTFICLLLSVKVYICKVWSSWWIVNQILLHSSVFARSKVYFKYFKIVLCLFSVWLKTEMSWVYLSRLGQLSWVIKMCHCLTELFWETFFTSSSDTRHTLIQPDTSHWCPVLRASSY